MTGVGLAIDRVVLRPGDTTKPDPFTILYVANPALERPLGAGQFVADPILLDRIAFRDAVAYADASLFGTVPGQAERLLADSPHAGKVRVLSIFATGLLPDRRSALVGEDDLAGTNILVVRRDAVPPMLRRLDVEADMVFVISGSPTHDRASAWGTTDDDARPGVAFDHDGVQRHHRFFHVVPGTAALHATTRALVPLHEFGHAFSSYTNGFVDDLYVDGGPAFNRKVGRPIPARFGGYSGVDFLADRNRGGLGYPPAWTSYHPALVNPAVPAAMDNFWQAQHPDGPMACLHDGLTKAYILDRLAAKVSR